MRKRSQMTNLDEEIAQEHEPEKKVVPIAVPPPRTEKPGAELKREITRDERDIFDHARAKLPEAPEMSDDYQRVIQSIYIGEGFFEACKRCDEGLQVGEGRSDHGSLNAALDRAEPNARLAHNLWVTVAIDRKRFNLDQDILVAAMRNEATAALQSEKASGARTKQITEADIAAQMQAMYPKEYREAEMKRFEFEMIERSMQNRVEVTLSKCRSVQTMFSKAR